MIKYYKQGKPLKSSFSKYQSISYSKKYSYKKIFNKIDHNYNLINIYLSAQLIFIQIVSQDDLLSYLKIFDIQKFILWHKNLDPSITLLNKLTQGISGLITPYLQQDTTKQKNGKMIHINQYTQILSFYHKIQVKDEHSIEKKK
ncbi:hypothetical protein pb186bvf_001559 [Paramecium bursaria]